MTTAQKVGQEFWRWLDGVAEAAIAVIGRIMAPRTARLVEGEGGRFTFNDADIARPTAAGNAQFQFKDGKVEGRSPAQNQNALRGARVMLVLRPDRFLFKPLELPARAGEFLDGVVRSQIDRLTPWSADEAAFGYTDPTDAGSGRIVVTVAATSKAAVRPYVQALASLGAQSVTACVAWPDATPKAPAITILEENIGGLFDVQRMRRRLLAILVASGLVATAAVAGAAVMSGNLQSRQDELARRIADRRATILSARNTTGDPATEAERALARRKNATPSSVIVLEVLSHILPDHTYVTELRIEGDKLRLSGITRDAPSLIRLIEQSRHFTRATFFAPTTRAPSDPGDRFNIEARIEPVFSPRS